MRPALRLGVDFGSVLNLVGAVLKYLGVAFLVPVAVALSAFNVRFNMSAVDERALRGVVAFVVLYVGLFVLGRLALVDAKRGSFEVGSFEALGAAAPCLGNVGPAFGLAGPFGSYERFSNLSAGALAALMWVGRLEIIPVAVFRTRSYWRA